MRMPTFSLVMFSISLGALAVAALDAFAPPPTHEEGWHSSSATARSTCTHVETRDDADDTRFEIRAMCLPGQVVDYHFRTQWVPVPVCALQAAAPAVVVVRPYNVVITPAEIGLQHFKLRCLQ